MFKILNTALIFFLFNLFTHTVDVNTGHAVQKISVNEEVAIVLIENVNDDLTETPNTTKVPSGNFHLTFIDFYTSVACAINSRSEKSHPRAPPYLSETYIIS